MNRIGEPVTAIGIDIGGTEIKAVLGRAFGVVGEPMRWRHEGSVRADRIVREVREVAETLINRAADAGVSVCGVGLAIPGIVDPTTKSAKFSANLGWTDLHLGSELEAALGLPVEVEHDVYAGALAEFTIGAGQGADSGAFVPVGTGMAAALLVDGRLWRGATRCAGEIGHIRLNGGDTPCSCGRRGCAELLASACGLENAYARIIGSDQRLEARLEAKEVAARAADGEPAAVAAWSDCVGSLARTLAALTLTADIETIVLGGGLSESGRQLLDPVVRKVAEELDPLRDAPEIRLGTLGQLAGARGAALHALTVSSTPEPRGVSVNGAVGPSGSSKQVQPMFMLAFDHRASTAKELFAGDAVTPEQWEILADAKTVIVDAAESAQHQFGQVGEVSVLIDPECGAAAVEAARAKAITTALALEISGRRKLELLDEHHLRTLISSVGPPGWGKVLLRWNPSDSAELKDANSAVLEQARQFCDSTGSSLLLELIVPPLDDDRALLQGGPKRYRDEMLPVLLPAAVAEITCRFGPPDLWKLQGVESPVAAAAVSEAASSDGEVPPILILGAGAEPDEIARWFHAAAGVEGYRGFAIGRSIWKSPIAEYLDGSIGRNAARDLIAARFADFIDEYMVATRVAPVVGDR